MIMIKFEGILLVICSVVILNYAVTVLAQSVDSQQYTIRAGDIIDVTVEGYTEYSKQRRVRIDGMISYPTVGEIKVEGMTTSELEDAIFKGLSNRLDVTKVYVDIVQLKRNMIYVLGMVRNPGRCFFDTENIYLLKALALAGDVDYKTANLNAVQLRRAGKVYKTIDLTTLIGSNDATEDIKLQPEDVVWVPSLFQQRPIFVTGAVLEQGQHDITGPKIHVLQALLLAGGPIQDIADISSAIIIRADGATVPIDLEQIQNTGSVEDSAFLSPGDILHVPNAYEEEKIKVVGAVKQPGQYPIKEPVDMITAMSLAGGWLEDVANLKKVKIIRADGTQELVNLLEIVETGNIQSGPMLYPGDTLQISKRLHINWYALLTVTSIASLIYNIVK